MKARPELLPPRAALAVARVLALGAVAYGDHRPAGRPFDEDFGAMLRHAFAWKAGETVDAQSRESALAHVAARALLLLEAEIAAKAAATRVVVKAHMGVPPSPEMNEILRRAGVKLRPDPGGEPAIIRPPRR